jgi:hypothetical protein
MSHGLGEALRAMWASPVCPFRSQIRYGFKISRRNMGYVRSPLLGNRYECVGEMIFCVHEPQYAVQDPSFGYNI